MSDLIRLLDDNEDKEEVFLKGLLSASKDSIPTFQSLNALNLF